MDFDYSPAQYELAAEVRRFLERECPTAHVREFIDDPSGWSRPLWKQMADLGWMALPFPEEYGGLGQGFVDTALMLGELGRVLAPVPYLTSVVLAGHAILLHGSEEQRRRWLPEIASGDRIAAAVLPDEGIETDRLSITAHPDGDGWRLTGERARVLDAPAADLFVVAAKAPDGARWFVAEDGAEVTPQAAYDPSRTLGRVLFDGSNGVPLAKHGLEDALRPSVAAACAELVGLGERILDMTVAYTKDREQFGRPIGGFQAVKHKCAEMAVELEASKAAALYACWAVESVDEGADRLISVAKSYCSDAIGHLAGEGVQVHGGIAYTWEHDMHLYLRRVKSLEAFLGDAPYHRERLARMIDL